MENTIKNLLEIQQRLLEQTKLETEAKLQVVLTTKELIDKQNEFIRINQKIDESIEQIKSALFYISNSFPKLESIDDKLQAMIVILQIMVSIMTNVSGVSKEIVDKLQNHILKLTELSIMNPRNNFENFNSNKSDVSFTNK